MITAVLFSSMKLFQKSRLEDNRATMRFGCCVNMLSDKHDRIGMEAVSLLKKAGFDYIELSLSEIMSLSKGQFHRLKSEVNQVGLPCEACNNFYPTSLKLTGRDINMNLIVDYTKRALNRAAELGARVIVFGSAGAKNVPPDFPVSQGRHQFTVLLDRISAIAAKVNIDIAIEHINRIESNLINTATEGLEIIHEVNRPNIRLLIDFYHLMVEKEPQSIILEAGKLIAHVHIAEILGRKFPLENKPEYELFFKNLKTVGYDKRISIEAYTDDLANDSKMSLSLLKKMYNNYYME